MHPIALLLGGAAVMGAGFGLYQHEKNKKAPPPATPAPTPAGNPILPVLTNPPAASLGGLPPLPPGFTNYAQWAQQQSPQTVQAHALHDDLKAHGITRTPEQTALVKSFQVAHNASTVGKGLAGQLDTDGEYDALTSAALTLYTGDPIPGDPLAKPPNVATMGQIMTAKSIGEGGSNTGSAFSSGFNVMQWLEHNGTNNLGNPVLAQLVLQFQHDLNTDPVFPGPAYTPSPKPPIIFPAVIANGDIGPQGSTTRAALKHQSSPDSKLYGWY